MQDYSAHCKACRVTALQQLTLITAGRRRMPVFRNSDLDPKDQGYQMLTEAACSHSKLTEN